MTRWFKKWLARPTVSKKEIVQIELHPRPDYRRRRFEHMPPERVSKALTAAMCVNDPALAERVDLARRQRVAAIKAGRA